MSLVLYGIVCAGTTLAASLYITNRYALPEVHWSVKVTVAISYFLTFSCCYLIPISLIPETYSVLVPVWKLEFWSIQIFTWLWAGLQQDYFDSGGFTFKERAIYSIKINAKILGLIAIPGIIFLIYVSIALELDQAALTGFVAALSNTIGLTLHILLMGYGLVEIPKKFWYEADMKIRMKHFLFKIKYVDEDFDFGRQGMSGMIVLVSKLKEKLKGNSELLEYDVIIGTLCIFRLVELIKLPDELERKQFRINNTSYSGVEDDSVYKEVMETSPSEITRELVVKKTRRAYTEVKRVKSQWDNTIDKAANIEEDLKMIDAHPQTPWEENQLEFIRYYFSNKFGLRLFFMRIAAVYSALMTCFVLWCEITMFASSSLSPFASLLEAADGNAALTQIYAAIPLTYICACSFYSAFILRIPGFYHVHDGKQTDSNSLLYNAQLLLRLILGVGYNFMTILHLQTDETNSFIAIMGTMDVVPLFGKSFVLYFPILTVAFCLCTAFNLWGRIWKCFGGKTIDLSDDLSDETMKEGLKTLANARRKRAQLLAGELTDEDKSVMQKLEEGTWGLLGRFGIASDKSGAASKTEAAVIVKETQVITKAEKKGFDKSATIAKTDTHAASSSADTDKPWSFTSLLSEPAATKPVAAPSSNKPLKTTKAENKEEKSFFDTFL